MHNGSIANKLGVKIPYRLKRHKEVLFGSIRLPIDQGNPTAQGCSLDYSRQWDGKEVPVGDSLGDERFHSRHFCTNGGPRPSWWASIPAYFKSTIEQAVSSNNLFKGVKKIKQKTDIFVLFKMYNGL